MSGPGRSSGQGARFVAADAADPDAVAASVHAAVDHLGGLDVLVNNAGAGVTARLAGTSLAGYDQGDERQRPGLPAVRAALLSASGPPQRCMIHIASDAGIWGE